MRSVDSACPPLASFWFGAIGSLISAVVVADSDHGIIASNQEQRAAL